MSVRAPEGPGLDARALSLGQALADVAALATGFDREPRFPHESFAALKLAGVPQLAADRARCDLRREIELVRKVAAADGSTARILDGHFNGVERLTLCAPSTLQAVELARVAEGELLLGVWGADPAPGEGEPAQLLDEDRGNPVLRGVKTFCSGAGGVQRALVVARDEQRARRLLYVDVTHGIEIDRSWYRASGLRSSESHRVEFSDTPVLAVLGGADELMREPWFSRDAIRTSATWAGLADCIVQASVDALGGREPDEIRLHTLGRMRVAQATVDRWLEHAAAALDLEAADTRNGWDARALAGEARVAIADAARLIGTEAVRVGGSRALAGGGTLDRARRDLDLFLLQHRLDPKLVEIGASTLGRGSN
jgi:alkylation response protein AidB-like acyl-CoA dehydrogenase